MKVIGAGFGRTGTTSLKAALEQLGFGPCYHMTELIANPGHVPYWRAAVNGEKVDWKELFRGYQSTVDWPACSYYKELMAEYPDAKVLLSVRDPEAWYQSCINTIHKISQTFPMVLTRRMLPFLPFSKLFKVTTKLIWGQTFDHRFTDKAHALAVFQQHVEEVKQYVSPDRLLVYDVKEGWEPLCRFLGVPVPTDKPFPRLNDTKEFQQNIKRAQVISSVMLGVVALGAVGVTRWLWKKSAMCLIVFAVAVHPALPLVVLANRDEFYARPAASAHAWTDSPAVFGGRDIEKGGTWLGVTKGGRFAAVTNVRDPLARRHGESRGALVRDALLSPLPMGDWAVAIDRPQYPAFNLLVGSSRELYYAQDASAQAVRVAAGVHGLSNARLDAPWPKVRHASERLRQLLATPEFDLEAAFAILADRTPAPDDELPSTGVARELERALSPAFITRPGYGTRACTVVLFHRDGTLRFVERTYGEGGVPGTATDVLIQVS